LFLHVFLALFQVLGVHPLAGADEVSASFLPSGAVGEPASHIALCWALFPQFSRARNRKVTAAGDDAAAVAKVEAAYEAIMMRQLALRMKGQGPIGGIGVSKEVAFADKAVRECSTP
jgi:Protein CHAPERONE-LIKE PROTEIN OF POR1-like